MHLAKKQAAMTLTTAVCIALGLGISATPVTAKQPVPSPVADKSGVPGRWLPGDFHQHTLYTDGSNIFADVMQSNADYGLDWWANSEHGGSRNRDGEGVFWDGHEPPVEILGDVVLSGGHQVMWRWQSLRDFVYPDILDTRQLLPRKTVISGLEWNVPGHEHCSTATYQYDGTASAISEFEYRYDRSDDDTSRTGEASLVTGFGPLAKTSEDAEDAVEAVAFMQALRDQGVGDAWVVPAHIERANSYTIADFRNWNNAGPDVAFGYEGAPGHQTSGDRGFSTGADGGGTYGGSGYYSAKVGGLWDALLGEGRNWWNFASSDYHNHWSNGGSDFWPGEYQKNYVFVDKGNRDNLQAVFDAVRSGASWHVEGDLIDELEFSAQGNGRAKAIMGQTLEVRRGELVTVRVKVHDPKGSNFCPLDMDNPSLAQIGVSQPLSRPALDHIDLIAGAVTGYVEPSDEPCPDMDTRDLEGVEDLDPYCKETNDTTEVVKTFERRGGWGKNGYLNFVYRFRAQKDTYLRLRGTNLPPGVPFETDVEGNPLADGEANDNLYEDMDAAELEARLFPGVEFATNSRLDEVAEAYADLWFYSNPIFIDVK
jgi:hypothetical protein